MNRTVPSRTAYRGETKLVISIDFGTTFSGTSWALLEDGQVPHIWDVTAFERQRHFQVSKVPTVLYYDNTGTVRAVGGQILDRSIIGQAVREQWTRVECFKQLLHPNHIARNLDRAPKEMPRNKKLADIIADFLLYMANVARKHFHKTMDADGRIWKDFENRVIYILSHPNGWNTFEPSMMREAAIMAGLVPNTDQGKDRIISVSEGEASLHYCMSRRIGQGNLEAGSHFIVVDAGGGTIDISSFKTIGTAPLEFEESSIPECHLLGSAFVTKDFRSFVEEKLRGSIFGDSDTIDRLVEDFDQHVKPNFCNVRDDVLVKFGRSQDNDSNFGITAGQLLVRGEEIAGFFEPACKTIEDSVKAIVDPYGKATVVLVGGLAGNLYLYEEVQRRLSGLKIQVLSPAGSIDDAVAHGGICFYLDGSVKARMAKWTYGVSCVHGFNPEDPKHLERKSRVQTNLVTGKQFIEGGFFLTLKKGSVVHETEFARFPFWHNQSTQTATTLEIALQCYTGDIPDIKFQDEDCEDQFQELCWFKAFIPESCLVRQKARGKNKEFGKYYYVSNFEILVSFGATELKCFVEWSGKKGKTQRVPITPIWNDGPIDSSRSSRNPRESRLPPQQDYANNLKRKEPSHKSETNPKQVRHIPPSMASSDGDLDTKLVISFDLGTTFSAASWVWLGHSQDPHIWDVSEFREDLPAKVPTVLYYDHTGKLRAVGSETLDKGFIIDAEEQGWMRVEWFKLLLPESLAHQLGRAPKAEMPRNKMLVEIIADFLRYMHDLSLKHFHETMDLDRNSSQKITDGITYIFSHPVGWNILQHSLIREAAILAKLVPNSDEGNDRIIFVSEAEASLHWCIDRRLAIRGLEVGSNYIVVDAGGGGINISSFKTVNTAPLDFEECSIPKCHLEGSAFVTQAFRNFVRDKLKGSSFGNSNAIEQMVKDFDHEPKHGFRDRQQDTFVRFGGSQDNDSRFGIDGGQLLVRGQEMAGLFEPACSAIVNSVKTNVISTAKTAVVLVGGFAGNEYLFKEIQCRLPGIVVTRPNDSTVKATAHGAICLYLERIVTARMAEWTYGVPCVYDFDPTDPRHLKRRGQLQTNPLSGQQFLDGGFFVTLKKGTLVRETELTRFPFWHNQPECTPTALDICLERYQGDRLDIKFRDEDGEEQFRELCRFRVTIPKTSLIRRVRKKQENKEPRNTAKYYYACDFHIVVSFGAPQTKFHVEWKNEKGRTQRGPITPISNSVHVVKLGFD